MPLITVSKIEMAIVASAGSATQINRPPRPKDANACSNTRGLAASTRATSAPPLALMARTGSTSAAFTTWSAPSLRARSSFSGSTSTASDQSPHEAGILYGQVAKATDAEYGYALGRDDPCDLQRFVGGHPGAA